MLPNNTLIVVADGHSATLFRNIAKHGIELSEVQRITPDSLSHESAGKVPDEGSPRADREADFASRLARHLGQMAHKRAFDDLAIAADPTTLGVMRKHYDKELQLRLRKEIAKDLTRSDLQTIEAAVG